MTFRAKPVANRPRRQSRDGQSRRNTYLNVAFGLAVFIAVVILIGVAGVTYYRQHLAAAATVGGQTITRDDFSDAAAIEVWRLQQTVNRVQAALSAGKLTSAEANQQIQSLNSQGQTQQLAPVVLERLIDARIQAPLAAEMGVTATPEQIDARITEDATTPEQRHAWIIAVRPQVDTGKTDPTDAQKAAAKKIADQALVDVTTGGKKWEDVAKAVSTDSSSTSGGDLGWIDKNSPEDQKYLDAIFAAEPNKPTTVLEGEDGSYLIGRVTEVSAASVDNAWEQKLIDAGLKVETYRKVVAAEVIRKGLEDKAIADATKATNQRQVSEIAIQAPQTPPGEKAVKVRHILFAPNHDAQAAQNVPADDPAWSVAQLAAEKAYGELQKDPSKFDAYAREKSDEAAAQGDTGTGGKLPYIEDNGQFVQEFVDAVLKDGLKPGDILPPVKTQFGWHVIQIMYRPPDIDEMKSLRDQAVAGKDFADLARNYSDGNEAGKGGDKGWIGPGLLDQRLLDAIYATQVGGISEIVDIKSAGLFLYKVVAERTQAPDADELISIKQRAFQNWYGEKKDAVTVTRELLADLGLG
jgi:parvulin-like peptidyl-prolyl isomerase